MKRFFNTSGPLNVAEHYVLDPLKRWDLSEILTLIDQKKYFLVHAPRQTGKTTCLRALADHLNQKGQLRCLYISMESGQAARQNIAAAMQAILYHMGVEAREQLQDSCIDDNWEKLLTKAGPLQALNAVLSLWCTSNEKPGVVLMDEIDALVGDTLIAVLRQLRIGYLNRPKRFPQSIVLCGMRHLRDYRMELGPKADEVFTEGSPFNINSESLRLGDFSLQDIQTLYAQHAQETGQQFEEGVCERVFELTQGQPWLVNALAYDVSFRDAAGRDRSKTITVNDVDMAKEKLIQRRETHLDQLMAKLKQERVQRVIGTIVSGQDLNPEYEDFEYVKDLGLIRKDETNTLTIANPIYREVIPRALTSGWEERISAKVPALSQAGQPLDMQELLSAFQRFFRQHSESWLDQFQYKEAGPQLLLQAFLQRTVNSRGSIQREQAVGSGRTDLIMTWPLGDKDVTLQRAQHKQIVVLELKLVRKHDGLDSTISKGLNQTARYMQRFAVPEGHLLIFDRRSGKSWDDRIWVKHETAPDGKEITVWGL
ncbi:MAG: AAA-like domain-containing protein [Myxococcota bacterium]